jgi:hypothetical protein
VFLPLVGFVAMSAVEPLLLLMFYSYVMLQVIWPGIDPTAYFTGKHDAP